MLRRYNKPLINIEPFYLEDMPKPLKRGTYKNVRKGPKINRNELCSCGSGKKYKKCCLLNK